MSMTSSNERAGSQDDDGNFNLICGFITIQKTLSPASDNHVSSRLLNQQINVARERAIQLMQISSTP
jgi:hypothetical protein